MKRPSALTRVAGAPFMALLLLLGSAIAILGWYVGGVSGWLALGAAFTVMQTLSALGKVRRYKVWFAEWETMGAPLYKPPKAVAKPRRRWKAITVALLVFFAIPQLMSEPGLDEGLGAVLICVWVVDVLYLAYRLFAMTRRRFSRERIRSTARAQAKADAIPVTWLLDRASNSPSRADAVRSLPEYSARLLSR